MKRLSSLMMLVALGSVFFLVACKDVKLDNDKTKGSYAIGRRIGESMKMQGLDADPQAIAMGMSDVFVGKEAPLKAEELSGAMMKLQEQAMQKMRANAPTPNPQDAVAAAKNLADGQAFLDANKGKPGVKVTASGLQYQVVKEGKGAKPKPESIVKVHYTGTLITGEKFDSSVDRGEPAEFPVNGVIKGWTEALQLMKPGGKMRLFIPAALAYGEQGRPSIPANSVLLFDVELISIK